MVNITVYRAIRPDELDCVLEEKFIKSEVQTCRALTDGLFSLVNILKITKNTYKHLGIWNNNRTNW